jgi:lipopolysaccharide export system protein LptA
VARAKRASFDELTKMIVLEGDAEVLSGQYYLRGNRINLFLDVNRGFAQGDETAPIEVTILMNESDAPTSFSCR